MPLRFTGNVEILNVQLLQISGVILMKMGENNIVFSGQSRDCLRVISNIIQPYLRAIPDDSNIRRQRIF